MHFCLVKVRGEDFDVTTTTVDLLLVLNSKLDDKGLALVAEGLKACGHCIKTSILTGLKTCIWGAVNGKQLKYWNLECNAFTCVT